ncbi:hypothetical protein B0H12DRAFT_1120543 [Mycena haematopus]|nr:hypothetical protein B0H12DRAFT_1120543 [Mycena haematopus]
MPYLVSHSLSLPPAPHFWCWRLLIHTNTAILRVSHFSMFGGPRGIHSTRMKESVTSIV